MLATSRLKRESQARCSSSISAVDRAARLGALTPANTHTTVISHLRQGTPGTKSFVGVELWWTLTFTDHPVVVPLPLERCRIFTGNPGHTSRCKAAFRSVHLSLFWFSNQLVSKDLPSSTAPRQFEVLTCGVCVQPQLGAVRPPGRRRGGRAVAAGRRAEHGQGQRSLLVCETHAQKKENKKATPKKRVVHRNVHS